MVRRVVVLCVSAIGMSIVALGFVLVSAWPALAPTFTRRPLDINQLQPSELFLRLDVFASNLGPARMLAWSPNGTLLVSITRDGKVVALPNDNDDGKADRVIEVISDLRNPHGLAVVANDLFIAESHRVIRLTGLRPDFTYERVDVILEGIPDDGGHFTRSLVQGSNGLLYLSVGSSCNVCKEKHPWRAAVIRFGLNGENPEIVATGLRNAVGLTLNPSTDELWATENGRDWLGDELPPEEVNVVRFGQDYGWPVCYGKKIHDGDFDKNVYIRDPCADTMAPHLELPAHTAPLGLRFYQGEMFPEYANDLLVALHGSWNRTSPIGYQVVRFDLDQPAPLATPFLTDWLAPDGTVSGRPVDITVDSAGAVYVSDDKAGVVYRVSRSAKTGRQVAPVAPVLQAASLPPTKPDSLSFLFFGDIMLDRNVKLAIQKNGFGYIFEKLATPPASFFEGYDLVSANLEGPVTYNGTHYPPVGAIDFAFSPEDVEQLKNYGFTFFTIANNHLADQGRRGIDETYSLLDGMGYLFSGCTDAQIGDCTTTTTVLDGKIIGLASLSMVYQDFDLARAKNIIASLASTTDMVIVNIHWGTEYEHQFSSKQQQIAHALVDAGADIIIGHHPHVIQGIEIYNNKPIFYSLGNFIFDQFFSADTQQGLAIALHRTETEGTRVKITPLVYSNVQIEQMFSAQAQALLQSLVNWSKLEEPYASQVLNGELLLP